MILIKFPYFYTIVIYDNNHIILQPVNIYPHNYTFDAIYRYFLSIFLGYWYIFFVIT